MELNKLYEIAEKENIKIYNLNIEDANGIYLNYDKINAIALNYNNLSTYIEEKCTLAEELGHYYYQATYSLNASKSEVERQEYRAKKWQFKTLVPVQKLKELLKKGYKYTYEIAEKLEVSQELVKMAYEYYRENKMIDCY
ncbi:MAG: ImmA/IrrE family metallo-endopeptidase [Clostridia bacterium]|nr:ImmA/IrrE family metallo-endopeptidase [Clostridia bacterium]